jgi:thiamine-monophosphate kinase
MGLNLLKKNARKIRSFSPVTSHLKLMKRHLMPEPVPLKNTSGITSMIDISDGLLIDLSHICDESRVGAMIYGDKIPLSKELAATAKSMKMNPVKLAMKGGEDYALLFTAPRNIKTGAFRIGEIIKKGRLMVDAKGRKTRFKPEGYEHFKK